MDTTIPMFPEWEDEYGQLLFSSVEKAGEEAETPPPPPIPLEPLADVWNWR